MGIGNNLKTILEKYGKTTAWLSRETGIPASTLRSIISRDSDSIGSYYVFAICETLKISMDELLGDYYSPPDYNPYQNRLAALTTLVGFLGYDVTTEIGQMDFMDNPTPDKIELRGRGEKITIPLDRFDAIGDEIIDYFDYQIQKYKKGSNNGTKNE